MALYRGLLTKLSSNINALRSTSVNGIFAVLPTVGQSFYMQSEPYTDGYDYREVSLSTTKVVWAHSDGTYEFETRNSRYRLENVIEITA